MLSAFQRGGSRPPPLYSPISIGSIVGCSVTVPSKMQPTSIGSTNCLGILYDKVFYSPENKLSVSSFPFFLFSPAACAASLQP